MAGPLEVAQTRDGVGNEKMSGKRVPVASRPQVESNYFSSFFRFLVARFRHFSRVFVPGAKRPSKTPFSDFFSEFSRERPL